jgi:hypothetical protein
MFTMRLAVVPVMSRRPHTGGTRVEVVEGTPKSPAQSVRVDLQGIPAEHCGAGGPHYFDELLLGKRAHQRNSGCGSLPASS